MEKMHYDRILNILAQSNKWELYEQLKGTQGMNNAILLDNERCKTDKLRKERDALKRQLQMNKHPISITHDREIEKEAEQLRKERDELKEYERYANEYKDWTALKQRIKELEERNQILYEEMVSLGVIPDRLLPKKH